MAKLKNSEQLQQILKGEHAMQQKKIFAISENHDKYVIHEVGDKWEEYDNDGKLIAIWEQKDGYRTKSSPWRDELVKVRQDLESYGNCYLDCKKKHTKIYDKLDKKFGKLRGMCFDCLLRFENKLKVTGKYKEYETLIMKNNAMAFFAESDQEILKIADTIKNGVSYVNSDGRTEKWTDSPEMAEKILTEYGEFKNLVLNNIGE